MFSINNLVDSLTDTVVRDIRNCMRVDSIKRKHICDFGIEHKYFDFRDTLTRYYVYLPFADTVELENSKILGKTLSIECYLDIRTGNIKYYILADGTLVKTSTGSVRLDLPVSSTSPTAKYSQIRASSSALYNQGVNSAREVVGGGMGGTVKGGIAGGVIGAGTGAIDVALQIPNALSKYAEMRAPMPTNFNGNFSPSTNVDDPLDIYLYTIESNIEYDNGIKNNYGLPDNTFNTINNYRGFIQCDDVKLTGTIPVDDKIEILNALKNGIYLV